MDSSTSSRATNNSRNWIGNRTGRATAISSASTGSCRPRATMADYYMARNSHGSTLSAVVHSWVLARANRDRAMEFFRDVLNSDVDDIQGGTTSEGCTSPRWPAASTSSSGASPGWRYVGTALCCRRTGQKRWVHWHFGSTIRSPPARAGQRTRRRSQRGTVGSPAGRHRMPWLDPATRTRQWKTPCPDGGVSPQSV